MAHFGTTDNRVRQTSKEHSHRPRDRRRPKDRDRQMLRWQEKGWVISAAHTDNSRERRARGAAALASGSANQSRAVPPSAWKAAWKATAACSADSASLLSTSAPARVTGFRLNEPCLRTLRRVPCVCTLVLMREAKPDLPELLGGGPGSAPSSSSDSCSDSCSGPAVCPWASPSARARGRGRGRGRHRGASCK